MKKTLIAIAALAATSAFAQSTVTLSGNIDFAGAQQSGTQLGAKGSTFSTTVGTSSTSVIRLVAVEDLGNGTKVTASYGLDPRTLSNDALSNTGAQAVGSTGAYGNVTTGLSRDAVFVGLEGAYGNVRLGSPNSLGLEVAGDSSPLGTGVGSGYAGNAGTMINSVVQTRYNRSARYDSPAFSGLTASVLYAPGGDTLPVDTQAATQIPNSRTAKEIALKYVNGPLTVSYVNIKQEKQLNRTGYYSGVLAAAAAAAETSANVLGVNYNIGNTTVYAGMNSGDRLAQKASGDGSAVQSKGTRYAIKQKIGQIDLIAQYTTQETTGMAAAGVTSTGNAKATVTGLRADYNLSKTTATYVGYEEWKTGATAAAGTAGALAGISGDRKIVSIGLRKSF